MIMQHAIPDPLGEQAVNFLMHDRQADEGHCEVSDALMRFVRPVTCVVDAGANVGYFSLLMAKLVGEHGLVVSFEPDERTFEDLSRNIELNNLQKIIKPIRQALWSEDRDMTFHPAEDKGYSSFKRYANSIGSYAVTARSLDTLLLAPHPSVIKIDCEGADEHILRGAEKILRKGVDCVIAEINFDIMAYFFCTDRSMRDYMNGLGYDCFCLEAGYKPTHIPPQATIKPSGRGRPGARYTNVMFAHKEKVEELWS